MMMMSDSDWTYLEKYLLEYRERAHQAYHSKQNNYFGIWKHHDSHHADDDTPIVIGKHNFLPLTWDNCQRPYLDLPDTLNSKERRKVHSLCAYIDLYHDTAGDPTGNNSAKSPPAPPPSRRISVSIYEDGLRLVPNREEADAHDAASHHSSSPLQKCCSWYYRAHGNLLNNTNNEEQCLQYTLRRDAIEIERGQIRQFANLPELTLRTADNNNPAKSCDDLDFNVLDLLDLSMEPTPNETPWMLVDTVDKLKTCVNELTYGLDANVQSPKISELAFDLEMHNAGKIGLSGTRTCLIQLTSNVATIVVDKISGSSKKVYKDYIIDPLSPGVWDAIPTCLGPIFSDPRIVKIGHGIGGMDTTSLHRDFGILVVNAFDTYEASAILSQRKHGMGLVTLCHHYGLPSWEHYKELKHTFQCSDWRIRPLEKRALEYGRFDIRYLVPLRKLLVRDLVKMDMLCSSGNFRVFSNEEEDSCNDLVSEQEAPSDSFDMRVDSTVTSSATSFAEDMNQSIEQPKMINGELGSSLLLPTENNTLSSKLIILASELPCYHHLMKAISISQKRCLKLWSGDEEEPILKNQSFLLMIKQAASGTGHGKYWKNEHLQLYRQLAEQWRVSTAERESITLSDVCTLDFLVHVAYKTPTSRCEMRRYSYILPRFLEDKTLPYFSELCEMVISSDAFHRRDSLVPETTYGIVYYSDRSYRKRVKSQKRTATLLVISAVIGVIAIAMRTRRK